MTDYSKLTDAQINRLVAERLGWREAVMDDALLLKYEYATPIDRGHLCLVAPDGHVYGATMKYNADDLWTYLFENEASWATDLNAAAGLDFGEWLVVNTIRAKKHTQCFAYDLNADERSVSVVDDSEARARCIAWLMHMDVTQEAGT